MEPIWFAAIVVVLLIGCTLTYVHLAGRSGVSSSRSSLTYEPVAHVFTRPITEAEIERCPIGDRVLLNGELVGTRNGIFVRRVSGLERAPDLSSDSQVVGGAYVVHKDDIYSLCTMGRGVPVDGISFNIKFITLKEQIFGSSRQPNSTLVTDDRGHLQWLPSRQTHQLVKVEPDAVTFVTLPIRARITRVVVSDADGFFWSATVVFERLIPDSHVKWITWITRSNEIELRFSDSSGEERELHVLTA